MSLLLNKNILDTPVSGVPTLDIACPTLNFGVDFAVKESNASEATLINLTGTVSDVETIRVKRADVANVYTNSGIDPSYQAPSKRGQSVVTQINAVYTVTDTADASYRVDLPVQCHLVLKIPHNPLMTEGVALDLAKRCFSTLFDTGSTTSDRLKRVLRGSLVPFDLT